MILGRIQLLWIAAVIVCPVIVCAADGTNYKTEKGIRFAVPDDWPIEERNGAVAPVSVEEYVIQKFKAIEARLAQMEKTLVDSSGQTKSNDTSAVRSKDAEEISTDIQAQLEALVKDVTQLKTQGMLTSEDQMQQTPEEKSVSDKNIAEQIRLIKKRLEDVERRLGVVEFHQDI